MESDTLLSHGVMATHSDKFVVDDFLAEDEHAKIHDALCSPFFPWYFQENITDRNANGSVSDFGFNHRLFHNQRSESEYFDLLSTLISSIQEQFGVGGILRARADMTVNSGKSHQHGWHIDSEQPHAAFVYYVNSSDGNTAFIDGSEVECKENRLLGFLGSLVHTGSSPVHNQRRIIINMNFEV